MKIALTSVFVNDPISAFKFYTDVLGFKEKMYMPEMRRAIVVSPEDPNGTALLLEPNENLNTKAYFDGIYDAKLPVIIFGVDDVQLEYERLQALDVTFIKTNENRMGHRSRVRRYLRQLHTNTSGLSPEFKL